MENVDFEELDEKINTLDYVNFSYKQKVQLMKAIENDLSKKEITYIANSRFSGKKMGLLISIFKMNPGEAIKKEILKNNKIKTDQLIETRKYLTRKLPKSLLLDMLKNNKSALEMYKTRNNFLLKVKQNEKEI